MKAPNKIAMAQNSWEQNRTVTGAPNTTALEANNCDSAQHRNAKAADTTDCRRCHTMVSSSTTVDHFWTAHSTVTVLERAIDTTDYRSTSRHLCSYGYRRPAKNTIRMAGCYCYTLAHSLVSFRHCFQTLPKAVDSHWLATRCQIPAADAHDPWYSPAPTSSVSRRSPTDSLSHCHQQLRANSPQHLRSLTAVYW